MRRLTHSLWSILAVLGLLASLHAQEVDDPSTPWDESIMPIIRPVIQASKTWLPPETINWEGVALAPETPLPGDAPLGIAPERLNRLFDQLNLDYPGLETVKSLYQAGELDAAGRALVEYYRAKHWAAALTNPETPDHLDYIIVELAMIDIFTQGSNFGRQPRRADGLLDWEDGGPNDDPEWAWWINRMGYLELATSLWEVTGDRRYAQFVNAMLIDWVRANPYPGKRSFSGPWRPLEVARRIDTSWLEALIRLRNSPDLTPAARLLLLSSIPDHANALLNYPSFAGNHLLTEKVMLAQVAVAFPEFKDMQKWLKNSVDTVVKLLDKQVYPDGAYEELTNHYQWVALGSFQRFLRLLETGGATELIARVKPTIEEMWNYFAYVMRPSGYGPLNNDSDLINNREVLAGVITTFDRPDWRYLATGGSEGEEPTVPPTMYFPWAGQAIMRDGWGPDAQWAFFDIGPYGSDHQHNDRLHLSVSFGGKDFLVDSGRYDYTPGPARDYHTGPLGHNTIMLNGQAPLTGPSKVGEPMRVTMKFKSDHFYAYASQNFPTLALQGKGSPQHLRQLFYWQGVGWIIRDRIMAFGPTKVEARWLFHPEREVTTIENGLETVDAEGANLRMELDSDSKWDIQLYRGQEFPFQAGWHSESFTVREPATQAVFTTMISSPTSFLWLIASNDADWDSFRELVVRD